MYEFRTKRRIEFSDVDLAGFVHFSRFFVFMETAEHELLRSLGTSVHIQLDGAEVGWPRLSAACEYFQPAKFEDELDIHVVVLKKGKRSMSYGFSFTRNGDLIARGQTSSVCCIIDPIYGLKAIPIPGHIAEALELAPKSVIRKATSPRSLKQKT